MSFIRHDTRWHQGNLRKRGVNSLRYPDASGETISNWTYTLENGATGTVAFTNDIWNFTVKSEASDTKRFIYTHPLAANIVKASVFTLGVEKFNISDFGSNNGECLIGLFKSGDTQENNSIRLRPGAADTRFQVRDSGGTQDQDTMGSALSTGTDYWFTFRGTGANIICDIYSSEANYIADGSGDVDRLTVAVADVGGTVTCDVIGVRNFPAAAVTDSAAFTVTSFDCDRAYW